MLNMFARGHVNRLTDPVGRRLVGLGIGPDTVTVLGTVGAIVCSVVFLPAGWLVLGAVLVTLFVLTDLIDGAMARALGGGTRFGAVLDSTCDRMVDGALFGALAWWAMTGGAEPVAGAAALVCLVGGQIVSYVKARAESVGLTAEGGFVERAERLILGLLGAFVSGLGVPYALTVALLVLAAGTVVTLGQRIMAVRRSAREAPRV
ncbi:MULTISPECIES: phosphatidylinositol phosphate synthase [Pseudonocardia]|uniref:Phosphatidylinositol phosphate synthase n=2 Tax=Pseudonocardia TaxID=1847 RepID=A0A1Y2N2W6_PSEAH|nr:MULTISPECIES: CDP-alcohol phosphatidyltransferase family protein [Pseudonocardia]OSY41770.1 CDP-diacylglycerol--inositol 3-phosphatidyltransferase [Pseudonocardia autotrophica]TDN71178.1 CDP-diacylglycerol--glycerol-3-phosphate 3-phosphatidyltransferase [Pseudonocardia autotrophica]BBG01848.1 CDP-diacylglycerol--glycerol-3-phosphate 3-phosphatidyltransferase [Pseudonocardia autotrophica]GEC23014.1 CDP-diacylglycerol--glycerol-3-phosphate 3-phosphatidyltransferase [Pseudonocardia saturnea]